MGGHEAKGWFQADDASPRGGDPDGAALVEGEVDEALPTCGVVVGKERGKEK